MPPPTLASGTPVAVLVKCWWDALLDALSPKRKLLKELRARWGARGGKSGFLASRYFELTRGKSAAGEVDDKTWADLEFPEIFTRWDTTVTPVGSQVLFAQLRRYVDDPDLLAERYASYGELARDTSLREGVQLRLAGLKDDANADVAELLFDERPDRPTHGTLLKAWSLGSLLLLVLVAAFGWPAWIWLAVIPVNIAIIFRGVWWRVRESEMLKHAAALLDVAGRLAAMRDPNETLPQFAGLRAEAPSRTTLHRILFWYAFMKLPLLSTVFSILNFAFLVELVIHARTIERFYANRSKLHASFVLTGEVDAAIALASCLRQYPRHCAARLVDARTLAITDGGHPLLPAGVTNSVRLADQSALVTGSNMAGKTTFIKMLACNAILARTAGFCLATEAEVPRATVMASIHGPHSVASGKSHYFTEIETIDGFIRGNAPECLRILVIDEPFSGTNTVERIAVARAVLEALASRAIVLVTTHDVELQAMLGGRYALYHFQENPDADGYFDYRLRPGPATERNAIRLLDRLGFPRDITANALAYAGAGDERDGAAGAVLTTGNA
jgi:hypothetical protein